MNRQVCADQGAPAAPRLLDSAPYFPPRGDWEQVAPAREGFDAARLAAAVQYAQENEFPAPRDLRIMNLQRYQNEPGYRMKGPMKDRCGPTGLVIRHGRIVASWGEPQRVDMTFSVSKSYLSTVAGVAYDDGLLPDLEAAVADVVWDGTFDGAHNASITWADLLNQSSDWRGMLFGQPDWMDRPAEGLTLEQIRAQPLHRPGTFFKYNDVRVNVASYALLQLLRRPLPAVLRERIMNPIGASPSWRWYGYEDSTVEIDGQMMVSVSGGGHYGGGMFVSTYDQARFGLLFLNEGLWNGGRVLSKRWIEMATAPSPAMPDYGFMWWLNRGPSAWPDLPGHLFFADGVGGNYVVVDREHDLLIVTRWMDEDRAVLGELIRRVIGALR
ncbi:serine hydrolase [Solimonas sp. C16B3]|uniref:Serine hydrolase n=1 Tax=Solimonas marina TaxID=2714601 RepID=A0A970B5N1_9GAMM|nr:serine hydrolase [Solimonas marina]